MAKDTATEVPKAPKAPRGNPGGHSATAGAEGPKVEATAQAARKLIEGRIAVYRGNPAAPLELWIELAELVYPAEHPILKELKKALVSS